VLRNTDRGEYKSVSQIAQASQHLEHFHVYKKGIEAAETVLPLHTDAGLFLAFVPGLDCATLEPSPSLIVEDTNEAQRLAQFVPKSIGILLGIGAEEWLLNFESRLRATRHAVSMPAGQVRAWYGKSTYIRCNSICG